MKGKIGNCIFFLSMLILMFLIGFCTFPSFTGYGWHILILPFLILFFIPIPGDSFKYYYIFIFTICIVIIAITLLYTMNVTKLFLPFRRESITDISGTVLYDSSFTKSGRHLMSIVIKECSAEKSGLKGTASGIITCIGKEKAIISSGIKIRLTGSFTEDGLFIYDKLQVLQRSAVNDFRERLIPLIEKRIMPDGARDAEVLSTMLLLGRAETYGSKIRSLASACGCTHVLALSGMHLHAVTAITKIIKNKTIQYILSLILVAMFIFIAGPRPSLVRSGIMVALNFLPIKERFLMAIIVQLALFPLSFANIGLVYALLSVFALIMFSEKLSGMGVVNSSLAVLCLIAPIELLTDGFWHPAVIIAGPIASLLAMASMAIGFLICVFSSFSPVRRILLTGNAIVYNLLELLFEKCSLLPSLKGPGYLGLLFVCLTLFILPKILQNRNRKLASDGFEFKKTSL